MSAAPLLAQHFSRTAFEVIAFLEPDNEAVLLRRVLADLATPATAPRSAGRA